MILDDQTRDALRDDFRRGELIRDDARNAVRESLEQHEAERIGVKRRDEYVCGPVKCLKIHGIDARSKTEARDALELPADFRRYEADNRHLYRQALTQPLERQQ